MRRFVFLPRIFLAGEGRPPHHLRAPVFAEERPLRAFAGHEPAEAHRSDPAPGPLFARDPAVSPPARRSRDRAA